MSTVSRDFWDNIKCTNIQIVSLWSCMESFPILFLSCTTPGAQLCFWPHLCMCATLRLLFPTQARGVKAVTDWGTLTNSGHGGVWQPQLGCAWSACSRNWQAVAPDSDTLSLVEVPPSAYGGKGWHVGVVTAPPLANNSAMAPNFLGRPCFFYGYSQPHSPSLPSLLLYLHSQQCSSPWSTLLTPHFSTQHLPAVVDSHLRQGCPGLFPKEALEWVALRTLEPMWVKETLAWGAGKPAQMGAPPSSHKCPRVVGPFFDSSFLLFLLSSYPVVRGFISCPFRCPKSSANVQQVLCENRSICRCILDVLVRRDKFCILLFCHLDSSYASFLNFKIYTYLFLTKKYLIILQLK